MASSFSTTSSLYDVLGVPSSATGQEIKAAYRKLARASHPDVLAARTNRAEKSLGEEFVQINTAYATLSDPGTRADYDKQMFMRRWSLRAAPLSEIRYATRACRNWETDQCW